ncbi:MAG: cation transporter [Bacteroidales bacterium]
MKKFPVTSRSFGAIMVFVTMLIMMLPAQVLAQNDVARQITIIDRILALWPFIISLVIILLLVLWYQNIQLRRRKRTSTRPARGINIMVILGIVTVFIVVLLALPWLLERMDNGSNQQETELIIAPENRREVTFSVEGMTCTGCEDLIQRRVGDIQGVESVSADHQQMTATVVYDATRTGIPDIVSAIEGAGYQVPEPPEE